MIESRAGGVIAQLGDDGALTIHLAATKRVSPQALAVAVELVPDLFFALEQLAAASAKLRARTRGPRVYEPRSDGGCPICGRRDTHTHPSEAS